MALAGADGGSWRWYATDLPFVFRNFDNRVARALVGDAAPPDLEDAVNTAWLGFIVSGRPTGPAVAE